MTANGTAGRAGSARELAKLLGLSHTAILKWLRDDRWPFSRTGPWSGAVVAKIRTWAAKTLAPDPAADELPRKTGELSPVRQIDAALKLSRKKKLDFELSVAQQLYHRVDECRRRRLRQIHETKTSLLNMVDGLPLAADDKAIVKGRVLEILRLFSAPEPGADEPLTA